MRETWRGRKEGRPGAKKDGAQERKMKGDRKPEEERGRVAVSAICSSHLFARRYEFLMRRVAGMETPAASSKPGQEQKVEMSRTAK